MHRKRGTERCLDEATQPYPKQGLSLKQCDARVHRHHAAQARHQHGVHLLHFSLREHVITSSSERVITKSSKVACRRRHKHQPTGRHGSYTHLAHDDAGHIGAVPRPQARRRGVEVRVADQDGLPAAVQQLAGNQVLHVDGQLLAQQLKSDHTSKEGSIVSTHRAECVVAITGAQESAIVRV